MTTLVTGAAGFVGTHLADAIKEIDGIPAIGADMRTRAGTSYEEIHLVDFSDEFAVRRLLSTVRPSRVVHLIGGAAGDRAALEDLNVGSARRLLDALEIEGIPATIVLLGSAAEYGTVPVAMQPVTEDYVGEPVTPYGRAKGGLTRLASFARSRGQRVSVARPFNIIGPGVPDSLVCGALIARIRMALHDKTPRRITVGRTDSVRDFVAVQDVARGLSLLSRHPAPALSYNFCTGRGHSIQQLLDNLIALSGAEISIDRDADLLRSGDVDQMLGDSSRAQSDLGWGPRTSFEEAVEQSWRWGTGDAE